MPPGAVVHRDAVSFQKQYGTLWKACEAYLGGQMLPEQAASFETIIDPIFLGVVAQTQLFRALTWRGHAE